MSVLLSIDPGVHGAGWAVWKGNNPHQAGTLKSQVKGNFEVRSLSIALQIKTIARSYSVNEIVCEFPQMFHSSKGYAATSSGDIYKLAYSIGVIAGVCQDIKMFTVRVVEWKGQLTKMAVEHRINKILGSHVISDLGARSHAIDAIGIGLYAKGRF